MTNITSPLSFPLKMHKQINLRLQISINLFFTAGPAWHEATSASVRDPRGVVKRQVLGFRQVHGYPWSSSHVLDPLKANRSKLGLIYDNPSLEPCTQCQIVSMNFGPGYISFCQHSHAPHPDQPASGREGFFMPWSGFGRVSLLHDRGHLAAPLFIPALLHCRSGICPRMENSRTNRHCEHPSPLSQQDWNQWAGG